MHKQDLNRLYQKILTSQATPEETESFLDYLCKNKEEKVLFDKLRTLWEIRIPEEKLINSEEKFEEIWKKGIGNPKKKGGVSSVFSGTVYYSIRIAATFLLIGLTTYFFVSKIMHYPIETNKDIVQTISVKNPAGQKQKVFLPDGSEIWLNAESELTYPSEFNLSVRKVKLTGEAYFKVEKDSMHPFVVTTQELSVTVHGTSFNVKSNLGDGKVQVSLLEGSVSVKSKKETKKLEPGLCYKYQTSTQKGKTDKFDKEKVLAWKNGVLLFEEDNLDETVAKLEKWFGVKVSVKGEPNREWKLNARFDNENIEAVMESLSFARNFSYSLKNNELSILFN